MPERPERPERRRHRLVGSSADWQELDVTREVGVGAHAFARARAGLLAWDLQRLAGLHVSLATPPVAEGVVVDQVLGLGRVGVLARCRVTAVVDEPGRTAWTYTTLVPHPEQGDEEFDLTHGDDDVVRIAVRSRSRLASPLARALPPLSRALQELMVRRYLRAAARLARTAR